jgi:hypothetical protein
MKGMNQVGAIALALSISGVAMAQSPGDAQKMEAAKKHTKMVTEQELHNHLMQNQAEQKQLQAALQQKQAEQLQMMKDLEKVKAAK